MGHALKVVASTFNSTCPMVIHTTIAPNLVLCIVLRNFMLIQMLKAMEPIFVWPAAVYA